MLKRNIAVTLILVLLVSIAATATAQTPAQSGGIAVPVTGKAPGGGKITGTFTILQFVANPQNANQILATGKLVLNTKDGVVATTASMPVIAASAAPGKSTAGPSIQQAVCGILDLTLGPLDLDLLGLVIHLDTVHLTIDADPAGGLLGQLLSSLLCDLLANLTNVSTLIGLLNQLITLLNSF